MKNIYSALAMILLTLAPLACDKPFHFPAGPVPAPVPTSSPTPNLTPVCGFTSYSLGTISPNAAPRVIRSQADWQTFYSYGTGMISLTPTTTPVVPTPPVDFTQQMLIVSIAPVCATFSQVITSVCEGPSQITISANNVQACLNCNMAGNWGYASAVAVPQSNLPIVWNFTQVPCQPVTYYVSPTPSPTP